MWLILEDEAHREGSKLCLRDFCKHRDREEVVVRPSQMRRGHQCEAADVAAAGQFHHPPLTPASGHTIISQDPCTSAFAASVLGAGYCRLRTHGGETKCSSMLVNVTWDM